MAGFATTRSPAASAGPRVDRQAEFTQLDIEMAFVDEEDVIDVSEAVMGAVFEVGGLDIASRRGRGCAGRGDGRCPTGPTRASASRSPTSRGAGRL
jgi:hypothetical protein